MIGTPRCRIPVELMVTWFTVDAPAAPSTLIPEKLVITDVSTVIELFPPLPTLLRVIPFIEPAAKVVFQLPTLLMAISSPLTTVLRFEIPSAPTN